MRRTHLLAVAMFIGLGFASALGQDSDKNAANVEKVWRIHVGQSLKEACHALEESPFQFGEGLFSVSFANAEAARDTKFLRVDVAEDHAYASLA